MTKTMSVVFEGVSELGGQSAESRRLTYAWRLRYLLNYNSQRYKVRADVLQFLIIIFAFASTVASVLNNYYMIFQSQKTEIIWVFENLAFLLPLVNTLFNGINAALNPIVKSAVLKIASTKIETEIYLYRTKVGPYSLRGQASQKKDDKKKEKAKGKDEKKDKKKPVAQNPRKLFSSALEMVWTDLAASDISKGRCIVYTLIIRQAIIILFSPY